MAEADGAVRLPSILFQSEDSSVVLLDVPKSIEEAQSTSSEAKSNRHELKRLVSAKPPDKPFKTPEPKDTAGISMESVSDLLAWGAATNALEVLRESYAGPWLLPRVVPDEERNSRDGSRKRKRPAPDSEAAAHEGGGGGGGEEEEEGENARPPAIIPKGSKYLHGTISAERDRFVREAPVFDLVVLDPPWPNRSVRRKKRSYSVANSLGEIRETLSSIPVAAHLATNGLVAVWITNRASIVDLVTGPRGLFAEWGLELIGEWTWLKVTASGEPIVDMNSKWRKPWERILIARRRGSDQKLACRGMVIVSVPDVHSRKPSLRGLFETAMPSDYRGLEVFARNLTAGWWSWGDEVLKFQHPENWVDP